MLPTGEGEGGPSGLRLPLTLVLALAYSGTAVTVETAFALGAAPSRCPSLPWGPQVSGQGGRCLGSRGLGYSCPCKGRLLCGKGVRGPGNPASQSEACSDIYSIPGEHGQWLVRWERNTATE